MKELQEINQIYADIEQEKATQKAFELRVYLDKKAADKKAWGPEMAWGAYSDRQGPGNEEWMDGQEVMKRERENARAASLEEEKRVRDAALAKVAWAAWAEIRQATASPELIASAIRLRDAYQVYRMPTPRSLFSSI